MKRLALALAAALLVTLVWFLWPRHDETDPTPSIPSGGSAPSNSAIANRQSAIDPPSAPPLEISHLADNLNSPSGDIRGDLRIVDECIATFRSNFPRDGNPVGSNAEITAALTGKNKFRLALIPPTHSAINRAGELCDRWGTPFYFHAESGTRMTIRSAGPDQKLHTADDAVFSP